MSEELVIGRLKETARLLEASGSQAAAVRAAAEAVAAAYRSGNKLLLCGNGGSAADAQHIAGEMTGRFLREREAWPAIALHCNTSTVTAILNDYGSERVFSRQVEALGRSGDALWAISTSGKSRNCIEAMAAAKKRGLTLIASVGGDGGEWRNDLWVYETALDRWTEVKTATVPPAADSGTCYDSGNDLVVLFNQKNQTWACKIERQ